MLRSNKNIVNIVNFSKSSSEDADEVLLSGMIDIRKKKEIYNFDTTTIQYLEIFKRKTLTNTATT